MTDEEQADLDQVVQQYVDLGNFRMGIPNRLERAEDGSYPRYTAKVTLEITGGDLADKGQSILVEFFRVHFKELDALHLVVEDDPAFWDDWHKNGDPLSVPPSVPQVLHMQITAAPLDNDDDKLFTVTVKEAEDD